MPSLEEARTAYRQQLEVRRGELERELSDITQELRKLSGASTPGTRPARGRPRRTPARTRRNGSPQRAARGQRKREALELVQRLGPIGPSRVSQELGIASSQAARLLTTLGKENAIRKTKEGWKAS